MELRTGSRGVVVNVWSDEARAAAIEARKAGQKESLDSLRKPGPIEQQARAGGPNGGKRPEPSTKSGISDQLNKAKMADSGLTLKEKEQLRQGDEGRKNYASLSDKEKKQYDTDWKDAHAKTKAAQDAPSAASHKAAATAHTAAAKSGPKEHSKFHQGMAAAHSAQAKSNSKKPLPAKHMKAAAAHLQAIRAAKKMKRFKK